MLHRWLYYFRLTLLDLCRLWPTVRSHLIVVAGICLPIFLLQGLKRGHVAGLREELQSSPTGRLIQIYPSQGLKGLMTTSRLETLLRDLGEVECIIPDGKHIADLITSPDQQVFPGLTFYYTQAQDPLLKLHNVDIDSVEGRGVVLYEALAAKVGVKVGDHVTLRVERDDASGRAEVPLTVAGIIPGGPEQITGFLNVPLHEAIERYLYGYPVQELGWPASSKAAPGEYSGYLMFCEPANDLSSKDETALERIGLVAKLVDDEDWRTLYGVLHSSKLNVYHIQPIADADNPNRRLELAPSDIRKRLGCDGVIIPWNEPRQVDVAGETITLVGITLPNRVWLRQPEYLALPDAVFGYSDGEEFTRIHFPSRTDHASPLPLKIDGLNQPVSMRSMPSDGRLAEWIAGPAVATARYRVAPTTAIVPVEMLAHLDGFARKRVQYDPQVNRFVPMPQEIDYIRARLYAKTIDDVPDVVKQLNALGYAQQSEWSRIKEIHRQDDSLTFIVFIVGLGVWLFGVFTVSNVLGDATDRKRSTIGILRVMGTSQAGIFFFVLMRAAILGLLAGVLSIAIGMLLPWPLKNLPQLQGEAVRQSVIIISGISAVVMVLFWWLGERAKYRERLSQAGWWFGIAGWALFVLLVVGGGYLLAWWIGFQSIDVQTRWSDSLLVFAGAITCCLIGSLPPAWSASQMDPFDAIIEGRFR